jgi:hypothetical protein
MHSLTNSELAAWTGVFLSLAIPAGAALYKGLERRIKLYGTVEDHEKRIGRIESHTWPDRSDSD